MNLNNYKVYACLLKILKDIMKTEAKLKLKNPAKYSKFKRKRALNIIYIISGGYIQYLECLFRIKELNRELGLRLFNVAFGII